MYRITLMLIALTALHSSCAHRAEVEKLTTTFEASDSTETVTYEQGLAWWRDLEKASPYVCMKEWGETDAGLPLHVVLINTAQNFNLEKIRNSNKAIWLINNGIHPGEPDGIDASMIFARQILASDSFESKFENVVIAIIPIYNVGGALNRNCCSRANQNGPASYGFRGNARNLDLNRDFAKADSKNAQSFIRLFNTLDPDIYLETHVSNGADYPYTMTYLLSHPDKLTPPLGIVSQELILNPLKAIMAEQGDEMIPYVNIFNVPPDSGYAAFYDSPRYSTGFTALHNSIGLLTETHMLKPYAKRVASTLRFLHALGDIIPKQKDEILNARQQANAHTASQSKFVIDWETDHSMIEKLTFKGYDAYYDTSAVSGQLQLYYNRNKPWAKTIDYRNRLKAITEVNAPSAYLVPLAWQDVVDRLQWNGVKMHILTADTTMEITQYRITDYATVPKPVEGHYFHSKVQVETGKTIRHFRKGEYAIVSLDQPAKRLLIEMLEPQSPDGYFCWNFYDEILQQKEWFSSYVFDVEAEEMLKDPEVKASFEAFLAEDSVRAKSGFERLYYLYRQSVHFEDKKFMIYPVFRID